MNTGAPRKTRRNIGVGIVVIALAGVGVAVVRNQSAFRAFPKRLATVESGILYRSGQPTVGQIDNLIEEPGIQTLLIVRDGDSRRVQEETEAGRRHGLNVVKIPIESRKPIREDQVEAFFRCVDDSRNHPILIHCSAGRHRTGYLCALYRIERQGWTVQRAIEEMLSFGFGVEKHAAILDQLERYEPGRLASQPEQVADIEQPAAEAAP